MHNRYWYLLSKKLSGNATDPELSELDDLLANNPDWQDASQHVSNIWENQAAPTATDDDFNKHLNRMDSLGQNTELFRDVRLEPVRPAFRFSTRRRLVAAGTIFMLLIIVIACLKIFSSEPITAPGVNTYNKIVTKTGNRTKMILPDGTQVWLNAESWLEYNWEFGKTNRSVTLSGEAYFDVVKNEAIPFIISTDKIHIKVTGTAFNVKAYPGEKLSETSLIRGRVEVTVDARPNERYTLKPNEKLIVRDEKPGITVNKAVLNENNKRPENQPLIQLGYLNYIESDSTAVETSWVYNRLIFDDESFGEISKKMERWYGVTMKVEDSLIAAQHLTYTIKNETVAQALRNMQYAIKFHYSINGNNISITK